MPLLSAVISETSGLSGKDCFYCCLLHVALVVVAWVIVLFPNPYSLLLLFPDLSSCTTYAVVPKCAPTMATPGQPPPLPSKDELIAIFRQGADAWNKWRENVPADEKLDLTGADLHDADVSRSTAQRSGPGELRIVDIPAGADLHNIDFRKANLQDVKFGESNLGNSDLREADLKGADLSGIKGSFLPSQLAGADLTSARLPEPLAKLYANLGSVSDISDSAKKLFLALLAACLYSWLTIATTKDVDLITNRASSPLPIIQTAIPIAGFYIVAPIILVCIYFYFHFYLQKLWEELAQLPAIFSDGKPLHQRVDPWLFNDLVRASKPIAHSCPTSSNGSPFRSPGGSFPSPCFCSGPAIFPDMI